MPPDDPPTGDRAWEDGAPAAETGTVTFPSARMGEPGCEGFRASGGLGFEDEASNRPDGGGWGGGAPAWSMPAMDSDFPITFSG